jgi:hypothetical protein
MDPTPNDLKIKPIDNVNHSLIAIKNKIDKINVDMVCIKADLDFIKQALLVKKDKPTPVRGGWIFS